MRYFRLIPFPMIAIFVSFWSATGSYPSYIPVLAVAFSIPAAVAVAASYIPFPSSWGHTKKVESPRSQIITWAAICFSIIIIVSTCTTQWPLRATFWLSKASLDALAQEVRAGNTIKTPTRAGFFTIEVAEAKADSVFLYISEVRNGDRGEPLVFIQAHPKKVLSERGENGVIVLDANWYFYNSL